MDLTEKYRRGRAFLTEYADALERSIAKADPPAQQLVEASLYVHARGAARRCRAVAALHQHDSVDAAAVLARTVIEIAYSAAYIAAAPRPRREHRAQRFHSFMDLQVQAFLAWRKALGLKQDAAAVEKASRRAREATRLFRSLESDLRSGWWGRYENLRGITSELEPTLGPVLEWLKPAYMMFSFHVHPTPLGLALTTVQPKSASFPLAIPFTVGLAAGMTFGMYSLHTKRTVVLPDAEVMWAQHFAPVRAARANRK